MKNDDGTSICKQSFYLSCLRINKYITLPKGTVERQSDNQLRYIILPNE